MSISDKKEIAIPIIKWEEEEGAWHCEALKLPGAEPIRLESPKGAYLQGNYSYNKEKELIYWKEENRPEGTVYLILKVRENSRLAWWKTLLIAIFTGSFGTIMSQFITPEKIVVVSAPIQPIDSDNIKALDPVIVTDENNNKGLFQPVLLTDGYTWSCGETVVKNAQEIAPRTNLVNHMKEMLSYFDRYTIPDTLPENQTREIDIIAIGQASIEGDPATEFKKTARQRSEKLQTWTRQAWGSLASNNYNFQKINELFPDHFYRLNLGKYQGTSLKSCREAEVETAYQRRVLIVGLMWKSSPELNLKESLCNVLNQSDIEEEVSQSGDPEFKFKNYEYFELLAEGESGSNDLSKIKRLSQC